MNPIEQVALAWQAANHTLARAGRFALWPPWLLLFAVHAVVIVLIWNAAHPLVSPVMARFVGALGGEEALRYPGLFRAMPRLLARAELWLAPILGALAAGAATLMFADLYRGRSVDSGAALRGALARGPALILALLPVQLLWIGASLVLPRLVQGSSSHTQRLEPLMLGGLAWVLQSAALFVLPILLLGRLSVPAAWAELPRAWGRGGVAALAIVALFAAPLIALGQLEAQAARIVERGTPELLGWLALLHAATAALAGFGAAGASTLLYLSAIVPHDERDA